MTIYREPAPRPPEARPKWLVWQDFVVGANFFGLGISQGLIMIWDPKGVRLIVMGVLFGVGAITVAVMRALRLRGK